MKRDPRSSGLLAVCLAASSWGTWPLIVRHGGQSGLVVGFLTMLVMSLPALGLFRQWRFDDRGAVGALVIIGIADAANVALYFSALEAGPVVVAVLTHYLAPVLVALAAPSVRCTLCWAVFDIHKTLTTENSISLETKFGC